MSTTSYTYLQIRGTWCHCGQNCKGRMGFSLEYPNIPCFSQVTYPCERPTFITDHILVHWGTTGHIAGVSSKYATGAPLIWNGSIPSHSHLLVFYNTIMIVANLGHDTAFVQGKAYISISEVNLGEEEVLNSSREDPPSNTFRAPLPAACVNASRPFLRYG